MAVLASGVRPAAHQPVKTAYSTDASSQKRTASAQMKANAAYTPNPTVRKRKTPQQTPSATRKSARLARPPPTPPIPLPPASTKPTQPFPFLALPAELRLQIYALALSLPIPIRLRESWKNFRRITLRRRDTHRERASLHPTILLASKQLHAEASPVLYGNAFALGDSCAFYHFLGQIGSQRRLLKRVCVQGWRFNGVHKQFNHPALTMLVDAAKLEMLRIEGNVNYTGSAKRLAESFFRDGHHWLEAVGSREGDKLAAFKYMSLRGVADDLPDEGDYRNYRGRWGASVGPRSEMNQDEFYAEVTKLLVREEGDLDVY